MFLTKNINFYRNYKEPRRPSLTAAEFRINKDLHEMNEYRITTKLFRVKLSNIIKDYLNQKLTMLVAMESIESSNNNEVSFGFNLYSFILFSTLIILFLLRKYIQ